MKTSHVVTNSSNNAGFFKDAIDELESIIQEMSN